MRKLIVAWGAAAAVALGGGRRAEGDEAVGAVRLAVRMSCEHVDGPGRVRCEVEARVPQETAITWGDVVLLKTPDFAGALRGRIGPRDAIVRDPDLWRWALALVARQKGAGDVDARVRVVLCRQDDCVPRETAVTGHLVVGE